EGGTFSGDTGEKQLFQIFQWWQLQEENKSINPNGEEYFTGTKNTDTDNRFFEGTWKIPASFTHQPVGMVAGNLYQGLIFAPGTEGTFVGTTPTAYTLEVILWMMQRQNDTSNSNPDKFQYLTARYDANVQMWEGNFKLPYTTTLLPNGGTQDVARAYLL
ncbi:MAG TPA: hypothetical protein VEX17_03670, partial [Bacillales bacterium]|nr:hypothetical protein [Bacillales bacterium]